MLPTQREVQTELRKFIRVDTLQGASLYLSDVILYAICIYGVLVLPLLWMKVIASIFAGVKISNLSVIAHDAAHNSLTKSRKLNKFIAITSFLPCLFNYQLWLYDHNKMHHSRTNEKFPDSYTPFSKEEFDSLPALRQWQERLYRKPSVLYFGMYYILERWSRVKFYPTGRIPGRLHASAWKYFCLLVFYLAVFIAILVSAPRSQGMELPAILFLGFLLPFYVFQSLYAAAVYVQHTHPRIPWFDKKPDRRMVARQEFISVHLQCPGWVSALVHHIFDHSAHHACPAIPCYQLGSAQARLNELLGENGVTSRLSLKELARTMRTCKLYDYENHCWLDFDGNRTTSPILIDNRDGQAMAA